MLSKIFAWYGIVTLLDPVLVGIVDLIIEDYDNGDLFKLYNYYDKRDGVGTVGVVLQILIYFFLIMVNSFLFYFYLVWIHMNGRVIDLYIRLNGDINAFFIPRDEEVSLNYLKWVCHKAIKHNHRVTNEQASVLDERARSKPVYFIHVYQFGKLITL